MHYVRVAKTVVRRHSDGKYLVLRCSLWPERPDRSQKPDLAGGAVEPGETFEQGAIRELKEETGIDIKGGLTIGYANSFIYEEGEQSEAVVRALFFVELENPEVVLSWEHEGYQWVTASELIELEWKPFYREAFDFMGKTGLIS